MLLCGRQGLISGNVRKTFLSPLCHSACCSVNSFCGVREWQGRMSTASLNLCRMTGELGFDFWHVYIFSVKSRSGCLWDQQSLLSNAYREFIRWVNWPECGAKCLLLPRLSGVALNQLNTKVLLLIFFYIIQIVFRQFIFIMSHHLFRNA
jgi:hypothetical protein